MTATNIRIMKEIIENKLFEHNLEASVCAQPVRPVQRTGQTGLHGAVWLNVDQPVRSVDKTGQTGLHQKLLSELKLCTNPPKTKSSMQFENNQCHDA